MYIMHVCILYKFQRMRFYCTHWIPNWFVYVYICMYVYIYLYGIDCWYAYYTNIKKNSTKSDDPIKFNIIMRLRINMPTENQL